MQSLNCHIAKPSKTIRNYCRRIFLGCSSQGAYEELHEVFGNNIVQLTANSFILKTIEESNGILNILKQNFPKSSIEYQYYVAKIDELSHNTFNLIELELEHIINL